MKIVKVVLDLELMRRIIQRLFTFMAFTLLYYNRKCHFGSKGTAIDGKKPYKIPTLHQ